MLTQANGLLNESSGLMLPCHLAQPMTRCLDGYDRFKRASGQFFLAKKVEVTFSRNKVGQIGRTDAHVTRREQHSLV